MSWFTTAEQAGVDEAEAVQRALYDKLQEEKRKKGEVKKTAFAVYSPFADAFRHFIHELREHGTSVSGNFSFVRMTQSKDAYPYQYPNPASDEHHYFCGAISFDNCCIHILPLLNGTIEIWVNFGLDQVGDTVTLVDSGEVAQLIPRIQDWLSPRIQESARKKTEAKLAGLK